MEGFHTLPQEIQKIATKQHLLWLQNPGHPSLQFKKVQNYWSARVTDRHRTLGIMDGDTVIWFWIGPPRSYEKFIRQK